MKEPINTPEEMLALLCERSPRQKASLTAVYLTCKDIADSGGTNFSAENIGRLGRKHGAPRAQTIRNKTGDNFKALIQSFKERPDARQRVQNGRSSADWVESIKDAKTRILVEKSLAELAEAKRTIREMIPPGSVIVVDDRRGSVDKKSPEFKLTRLEREALEFLLSDSFLSQWKFFRGQRGDVLDSRQKVVFIPATVPALEKALKYL